MVVVASRYREGGYLCLWGTFPLEPHGANAHRYLSRPLQFIALHDGRAMAHRPLTAGQRVLAMIGDDR